jgi:hypothetical protein
MSLSIFNPATLKSRNPKDILLIKEVSLGAQEMHDLENKSKDLFFYHLR